MYMSSVLCPTCVTVITVISDCNRLPLHRAATQTHSQHVFPSIHVPKRTHNYFRVFLRACS